MGAPVPNPTAVATLGNGEGDLVLKKGEWLMSEIGGVWGAVYSAKCDVGKKMSISTYNKNTGQKKWDSTL